MTAIAEEVGLGHQIPELYAALIIAGSEICAVGRPGHGMYNPCMTLVGELGILGDIQPNAHLLLVSGRGEAQALGQGRSMERFRKDSRMELTLSTQRPPDLHGMITAARGQTGAIGRPDNDLHRLMMALIGED